MVLRDHFLAIHLAKLLNFDNTLPNYWGNMLSYTLLMGIQINAISMKGNLAIPMKVTNVCTL